MNLDCVGNKALCQGKGRGDMTGDEKMEMFKEDL